MKLKYFKLNLLHLESRR